MTFEGLVGDREMGLVLCEIIFILFNITYIYRNQFSIFDKILPVIESMFNIVEISNRSSSFCG